MNVATDTDEPRADPEETGVAAAVRFLTTLFAEADVVLIRPIESWTEEGRKRSRVDYRRTRYREPRPDLLTATLHVLLPIAEAERLNLFFGVCPRFGGAGRFDLAWQVRVVRALWADLDHVGVDEARRRVDGAGLPTPSIVVGSGHGVHLYWLLDAPYLIDDAGPPPPVETEWTEAADGRRKPRKYVVEDGERAYLDRRRHVGRLSPRARHLQDVLAGIAGAIDGDHTTDLARLLRIPGTLNRKDQRNGAAPRPTALVECEPDRRYALDAFERLKAPSPEAERQRGIEGIPLPTRRKLSASQADRLSERIAASGLAPQGRRSEADFALCCFAIREGVDPEALWPRVETVGKFAEGGRRYFDRTWANAEYEVRSEVYERLTRSTADGKARGEHSDFAWDPSGGNGPPDGDEDDDGVLRPTITVEPSVTRVGTTLHAVTDRLLAVGGCYSRADQLVVLHGEEIAAILTSPELAGLLNEHVEFFYINGKGEGEYKPFPANYASTWLNHHAERSRLPVIRLYTRNPVYAEDWRLVSPGYDPTSGIYYAGPAVEARDETEHLDALLRDFCFRSPGDRTNYIGLLLTALLVPRFLGSKPAGLFNGNQPGLGKSVLAQVLAILRDGRPAETASYNPNDEEFEKRLGAVVRRGATTILIDNAKSRRGSSRIESACLERSITDPVLSFRLLGQSATIRAENSHIFCVTANTPDVSRDLVTRSVVIDLHHEGDPARRTFSIADPEGYAQEHRSELLGELVGMVERWKASGMPRADVKSRFNKRGWGNIVGGILDVCGEPDFLENADEAAATLDETRREFTELVGVLAAHPQGFWTGAQLVELCRTHGLLRSDLGNGSPRSLATRMGTIAGRFIDERFPPPDGGEAVFRREAGRKGNTYRVSLEGRDAEP